MISNHAVYVVSSPLFLPVNARGGYREMRYKMYKYDMGLLSEFSVRGAIW